MKRVLSLGGLSLSMLVLLVFGERRVVVQERARYAELQAELATNATRSAELPVSAELPSEAQAVLRDLPRLRNEVRQLREAVVELKVLREERVRLDKEVSNVAAQPKVAEPTPEAGFLMKSAWTFAGFATPESALQSFFAAVRDTNIAGLRAAQSADVTSMDDRMLASAMKGFRQVTGYRVVAKEAVADTVILKVQAAANGITADVPVRWINGEWKMDLR